MSWKYYKDGELIKECNDIPETMEDAVIELQENGVDVSDCVDDNWSPDYPPEEAEYQDTMIFKPLSDEDAKQYKECIAILKSNKLKTGDDFLDKLHTKIYPTRLQRFKTWCRKWYYTIFK